tara:strand:- start:214 stop:426 length:213 start_codon:yes stop_codon:yes gene_type:complete
MIKIFTKHPKENGHSGYFSHLLFSFSIGVRLMASSVFFLLHSVFPFVPVPKFLNLEKTTQFLIIKNHGTL